MSSEPEPSTAAAGLEGRFATALARLAPPGDALVVAVSGGADSVAAALLVAGTGRSFTVAHFDHGLRPESGADAESAHRLAAELGAGFRLERADVRRVAADKGWNLEDAARRLRYAFLHRVLKEVAAEAGRPGWVVVAHTQDDQAETFLLQLMRGAAYPAGMAERRGAVIRPLLAERGADLRRYLGHRAVPWREDATNLDESRSRAWVRHAVLPAWEERFPGATARLAGTASELRSARSALEALAIARFGAEGASTTALAAAPPALRRAAIAQRLRAAGAAPTRAAVGEVEDAVLRSAAPGGAPPWRRDVGRGARASVAYGRLEVGRAARGGRAARAPRAGGERADETPVTSPEQLPAGVDPAVLESWPRLVLRSRRPGDRIHLPGGSKLVSDLLVDRKVPREERDALTLLVADQRVLWVEGVAAEEGVARAGLGPDADRRLMRRALEEARKALEAGEVPVGAVVVVGGEVVAVAHNLTEANADPTAHAELLALRRAAERVGDWRLRDATLYVTLEPCPMCLGASLQAQLGRLVYGAANVREGALGGVIDMASGAWKRFPAVSGGVEAGAASALLREAFARRRAAPGSTAEGRTPVAPPRPHDEAG